MLNADHQFSAPEKAVINAAVCPIQATAAAKKAIELITGAKPEAVSRCEREGEGWVLTVEIVETAAQIADNDIMATYQVDIDGVGSLLRYERTNRYTRK